MNLLLATGNSHKAEEFASLLKSDVISVKAAPEKIDVVEDGDTFIENAQKKAEAYFLKYKQPVFSDDSGLVVASLPGELGVHTARFGGDELSAKERNELLIKMLEGKSAEERSAYFVCVLCFYLNDNETFFFEGRLNGKIASRISGADGFGYDPVFIPEGGNGEETLAEMPKWKEVHSHRALACQHALTFFKERVGQN